MFTRLKSLLQQLEVNRAVGYQLLSRGWQFLSYAVSIWVQTHCLDDQQFDLYQLFGSLLGMQIFIELGLPTIIVPLTSHEWAQLRLNPSGAIEGDPQALTRLATLSRAMDHWFRFGAIVFAGIAIVRGFTEMGMESEVSWQTPWVSLVLVNALAIPFVSRLAILEGCQQVTTVNGLRLGQAITGTIVVWAVLLSGGGLLALPASALVRWGWEYYIVHVRYRELFDSLRGHASSDSQILRRDVWPLGWRIAVQAVASYFGSFYLTQVVYDLKTPGDTGRWQQTWLVLSALQSASLAWVQTRTPELALLAAQQKHTEMRQRLRKVGLISLAVYGCGVVVFLVGLAGLKVVWLKASHRFLDLRAAAGMALGFGFLLINWFTHSSVRYDKRDPFVLPNLVSSFATAGLAWWCGTRWGVHGVVAAFSLIAGAFTLPVGWGIAMAHVRRLGTNPQR